MEILYFFTGMFFGGLLQHKYKWLDRLASFLSGCK